MKTIGNHIKSRSKFLIALLAFAILPLSSYGAEKKCSSCNGSGSCTVCMGTGKMQCVGCYGTGKRSSGDKCTSCKGTGKVSCPTCKGSGKCKTCIGTGKTGS